MKTLTRLLALAALALPAAAEESLDDAWKDACLWEVGSNVEKVPEARKKLVAAGAAALDFIIPAKLDTADGLVFRALETTVPVIAGGGDPALRAKAIAALRAALASDKPNVRRNAASLLGQCGAGEAAAEIAALLKDPDARGGALAALGALRLESSVPAIVALFDSGEGNERLRMSCITTIGAIGGPDALRALVRFLSHKAAALRFAAQYALEGLRAVGSLQALLAGPDRRVRLHAISALGRLGDRATRPDLRPLAGDPDPAIRGFAVEALGLMPKPSDAAWMREALRTERDPFVQAKLEEALRRVERGGGG